MATSTLQTNSNNDLYLPDGRNLIVVGGIPACSQSIGQATKMRLGEDIYSTLAGVDYFGTVFTPQPDYDAARQSLTTAILSCPDVISIESLSIEISADSFNYVAEINTIYGPIPVSSK
jgi:hypothetical protein